MVINIFFLCPMAIPILTKTFIPFLFLQEKVKLQTYYNRKITQQYLQGYVFTCYLLNEGYLWTLINNKICKLNITTVIFFTGISST
jgi:hypothetical protein